MPQNQREEKKVYKSHLVRCMNLVKGMNHPEDCIFDDDELYALLPEDILRYFALIVYGKEETLPTDQPTHGRSTNLEFAKKSISYYMPNRNMVCNEQTQQGNPTR